MGRTAMIFGAALVLAACDGPQEQAGEKADNASGVVDGEDSVQSGPAETMGERRDQVTDAANDAREAEADALEEQADAARQSANEDAERLEQQAEKARQGR